MELKMSKEDYDLSAALRNETFRRAESTEFWISEDLQDELYFESDGKVVNHLLRDFGNDFLDEEDIKTMAKLYVGLQLIYLEVKKDFEAGKFVPNISK